MNVTGFTRGPSGDYVLLEGSGRVWLQEGKLRGEHLFRLFDYTKLPQFVAALGGGILITSATGTVTTYNPPHQFSSHYANLWCTGAQSDGLGVGSMTTDGDPTFDGGAKVTASYETLSYDPRQGKNGDQNPTPAVYVTERRTTSGRALVLPRLKSDHTHAWKWLDFGEPLGEEAPEIVKVEAHGEYILTRHFVPIYNQATIDGLIGKINSGSFPGSSSLGGYPEGTLLFMGDEADREYTSDGNTKAWSSVLRFEYNPNGWNKLLNPNHLDGLLISAGYETVVSTADSTTTIYEEADFSPLLS